MSPGALKPKPPNDLDAKCSMPQVTLRDFNVQIWTEILKLVGPNLDWIWTWEKMIILLKTRYRGAV